MLCNPRIEKTFPKIQNPEVIRRKKDKYDTNEVNIYTLKKEKVKNIHNVMGETVIPQKRANILKELLKIEMGITNKWRNGEKI